MRAGPLPAIAFATALALAFVAGGLYLAITRFFPPPPDFAHTGGYVFVYEVDVPDTQRSVKVVDRVIDVLRQRVDPRGSLGVVFRPLGNNRLEVRVPVPPDVRRQRQPYSEARRALIAAGVGDARLEQILALPAADRERAWQRLAETDPDQAGRMEVLGATYAAYERAKGPLDDPRDVVRLLRGPGELEFHIAVRGSNLQGVDLDELRRQMAERGPDQTESPSARWFPINDLKQWYDTLDELDALLADPIDYFASAGRDLVAAERQGRHYLLLYVDERRSMTHEAGKISAIQSVFPTVDNFGREAVGFQLDGPGGREMNRLTGPHVGEPMAIVLDREVYSAPRINQAIGPNGIIQGNFSADELSHLLRVLGAGSLEARLSPEPVSVDEVEAMPPRSAADGPDS
jgi:preprotein translocase subunit SecD